MKNMFVATLAVVLFALVLSGCGKTPEQTKMESDMRAEVDSLSADVSAKIAQADATLAEIMAAMAQHDSLVAAYPKETADHKADNLVAAKERLTTAKDNAATWLAAWKPAEESMAHDAVMQKYTQDKTDLGNASASLQAAIDGAKTALNEHTTMASQLMAKKGKR
jgi:hypothetical protein